MVHKGAIALLISSTLCNDSHTAQCTRSAPPITTPQREDLLETFFPRVLVSIITRIIHSMPCDNDALIALGSTRSHGKNITRMNLREAEQYIPHCSHTVLTQGGHYLIPNPVTSVTAGKTRQEVTVSKGRYNDYTKS